MRNCTGLFSCFLASVVGSWVSMPSGNAEPGTSLQDLRIERARLAGQPRRLIMNNDGCDCLYFPSDQEPTVENFLELRTTALAGTQVDTISYCTISSGFGQFTHNTNVAAVLDDPLPAQFRNSGKRNITRDLIDRGTDPLRIVTGFTRENGMECFWSMRMNDTHDVAHTPEKPYFLFPPLKKEHPEWLISDPTKRTPHGRWSSVNYALPEIRDLAFHYIEEVCQNYDVDGVEMDFFRHLTYFPSVANGGKASEGEREMMTQLMRRIRTMTETVGLKRNRPILLAIRLPDSPAFCRDMGLDLEKWLSEGLVDILIPSGYFRHHHWEDTVKLGHAKGVQVVPCLTDSRVKGESRFRRRSIEGYRGRAANAWAAGADGLEIFNVFNPQSSIWNELGDAEELELKDKLYFVTPVDGSANSWMADGEAHREMPLLSPGNPTFLKAGKPFVTEIVISEDPSLAATRTATLHLNIPVLGSPENIETSLNGHVLQNGRIDGSWIDYPLSGGHLKKGTNGIELQILPSASGEVQEGWIISYEGDTIPSEEWSTDFPKKPEAIQIEVEDGALLISDQGEAPGEYHYYHYGWGADPEKKNVIEARVKVVSGSSFLIFDNGRSAERLRLSPGEIGLHHNRGMKASLDTTSDFRTYRLEMQNDDLLVYVDGKLALDMTGKFVPREGYRNRVSFGAANSTALGAAYWGSVKVSTTDAGQALKDIVVGVQYEGQ